MDIAIATTCCFTGHRPGKLAEPQNMDVLRQALRRAIADAVADGYDTFLCGMAQGVDTWAAEEVLRLRQDGAAIRLIGALPCPQQDQRWQPADRQRYRALLARLDDAYTACATYTPYCMSARNRWMVDHASRLIAVYNGSKGGTANTIAYARKKGRELILLSPAEILGTSDAFTL